MAENWPLGGGHPDTQRQSSLVRELTTARDLEALRFHQEPPEDSIFRELVPNIFGSRQVFWDTARSNAGFSGDCRYVWEKVLDMSLTELVAERENISLPKIDDIDEAFLNIEKDETSDDVIAAQKKKLSQAHDKFDLVTGVGIKRLASELSHGNMTKIREWGSQIGRAKAEAFRDLHDENMRISLQASTRAAQILNDLSSLVRARKPKKWSPLGMIFNAKAAIVTPRQKDYFEPEGLDKIKRKDRLLDYRLMSEEKKKEREDFLLQALEEGFSTEMGKEEDRTVFAEQALEIVQTYEMLLRQYQRALKKNRERIIAEEKTSLSQGADDSNSRDEFSRAASRAHEDIDNTLEALEETVQSCAREYEHYITCIALHKENKRKMRGVINRSIETIRHQSRLAQRVMLEQNVFLAGEFSKGLDRYDQAKQIRIATNRIRKAMFKEVKNLVNMQKQMVKDESMVLGYEEPVALIEHKKELLALPDLSKTEREPE